MKAQFGRLGRSRGVILREKLLITGSGGLLIALIVSVLLFTITKDTEARQDQPIRSTAQVNDSITLGNVVLVAPAENVPAGTKLSRVTLRGTFWPRDKVPEGAVTNADEIKDMFTKVDLIAGQPILRNSLTLTMPSSGIDGLLPEGHRAITIEVDATSGIEGWATPGAHVDLLLTYLDSTDGLTKTRVAVEDAVVVSFNGSTDRRQSGTSSDGVTGRAISSTATVTLAVPFEDSLKLQTARKMGSIAMALRNLQEVRSRGEAEFTSEDFKIGRKKEKAKSVKGSLPQGYVSFKDEEGKENKLMLGEGKWYRSGGED